jgi:predicted dehydrogenase
MALALGLVGCGNMGRRHIRALGRLKAVGRLPAELVAVVDEVQEMAAGAADLAEQQLGRRPPVYRSLPHAPSLDAVIVTVPPQQHSAVVIAALHHGAHVLVEKPLAVTVSDGQRMVHAAADCGRVLAVAENYRRDPMNRLAKALADAGTIGRPFLMVQHSASPSGERVIISPWRHQKRRGGILLDMGVHYADLLEYFLGPVGFVSGASAVVDRERVGDDGHRYQADAEDLVLGTAHFVSGALGSLVMNLAGRGEGMFLRAIYGTAGSLTIGPDRTGQPLKVTVREQNTDRPLPPEAIWRWVPDFALEPVTAALFGAQRLLGYDLEWATTDANLVAIEQDDFFRAVMEHRPPEVDARQGLRSVAVINGMVESDRVGRRIDIEDVLNGRIAVYENELKGGADER